MDTIQPNIPLDGQVRGLLACAISIQLAYSLFMDKYKYCFNECFPEKLTKLKMNKKYVKKEPWMTDDLMIMLKEKSKLYCKKN